MYRNLLKWFAYSLLLSGCSGARPYISVVCEENEVGNCVIKWETAPHIKGEVKAYASTIPDNKSEDTPVAIANISDERMAITSPSSASRHYYTLIFNNKYKVKVAPRNINIPGIQNFRDIGGYPSYAAGKSVRWGMLYRSGEIDRLGYKAYQELKNIGIKTIIDLRSKREMEHHLPLQKGFEVIHIPIQTGDMTDIVEEVKKGKISNETVYQMVKGINRKLVADYKKEYKQIFDILQDKSNYPIVIHCNYGKGRTGVVSALILAALGVNDDDIFDDYCLSNDYFNIAKISQYAYELPVAVQESITTLYSSKEDYLDAAKQEIEREYGDVDTYLQLGIGLSQDDLKRLQSILLTNEE